MADRRKLIWGAAVALPLGVALWAIFSPDSEARMLQSDPETILADPALAKTALSIGGAVFARECASCHGTNGGVGRRPGVPDLTDAEQIYNLDLVTSVEQVVRHGIRAGDPRGWNLAVMPAYARADGKAEDGVEALRPQEVADVATYLRSLHGDSVDEMASARGAAVFAGRGACFDCHSADGSGDRGIGAPSLIDNVWLYGDGSAGSLRRSIAEGHAGIMPAFARRLTPAETRAVAVYTYSLSARASKESAK